MSIGAVSAAERAGARAEMVRQSERAAACVCQLLLLLQYYCMHTFVRTAGPSSGSAAQDPGFGRLDQPMLLISNGCPSPSPCPCPSSFPCPSPFPIPHSRLHFRHQSSCIRHYTYTSLAQYRTSTPLVLCPTLHKTPLPRAPLLGL